MHRRDGQVAQTALSNLSQDTTLADQLATPGDVAEAAVIPGAQTTFKPRNAPVETEDSRSRVRQRQYCLCGQCRWCLDNARWERIFNEKFLDPTYYGRLTVRHSSTLAEAR